MKKKIAVVLITLLTVTVVLSGCLESNDHVTKISDIQITKGNIAPVPVISVPKNAFFDEEIEFDAAASYDSDGQIETYMWFIGEEEPITGEKIQHTFNRPDEFDVNKCPYIYEIQLHVTDNNGSHSCYIDQILLSQKDYKVYFNSNSIVHAKPSSGCTRIKASLGTIRPIQELIYELDDSMNIGDCNWNSTIYLEKPSFAYVKSMSLTLYDDNGKEIVQCEGNFNALSFWKEKEIFFSGTIAGSENFKSAKIVILGFSLNEKICVLYGGEKASQITFDFSS